MTWAGGPSREAAAQFQIKHGLAGIDHENQFLRGFGQGVVKQIFFPGRKSGLLVRL